MDLPTQELINAQLKHTGELIKSALEHGYSDDGYDYLTAGLALSKLLLDIQIDDDKVRWQALLSKDLADYACDGICEEIWTLRPAALAFLMDEAWGYSKDETGD